MIILHITKPKGIEMCRESFGIIFLEVFIYANKTGKIINRGNSRCSTVCME